MTEDHFTKNQELLAMNQELPARTMNEEPRTTDHEPRTRSQEPTGGERMPCKIELLVDIVVEPDESEFLAYCPALKGLHVGGATAQEAMENANDAIACHLTSMMKHGDPIPEGVLRHLVPRPSSRDRTTGPFA